MTTGDGPANRLRQGSAGPEAGHHDGPAKAGHYVRGTDLAGSPAARVVVVGFSQGACLAAEYGLRRPGRCGALVMFTGGLIGPPGTSWRLAPPATTLGGLPVLLTGSDVDEWVPETRVRETASVLTALGADVRCHIYAGRDHLVCDEEL